MGNYNEIQKKCKEQDALFEDPNFPAEYSSLGPKYSDKQVVWLRPREICEDPRFKVSGYSRFDVVQGTLGDCWLLAAMACVSERPQLLNRVLPKDQSLDLTKGYCGVFHFHFYCFGEWKEVIIDDRLPTDGKGNLWFTSSSENNEFWGALLEKAFAKLHGSYENLSGGHPTDALQELTGGVVELLMVKDSNIWQLEDIRNIMFKGFERNSFFSCSVLEVPHEVKEKLDYDGNPLGVLENGIVLRHAYSVTDMRIVNRFVKGKTEELTLVRVRNPWGTYEWNGKWSDKSAEWKSITEENRKQIGLVVKDDGEFWMEWHDFVSNFQLVYVCHLHPDDVQQRRYKLWNVHSIQDNWTPEESAGGVIDYQSTFWKNPQYLLRLDDSEDSGEAAECLVSVEEPSLRSQGEGYDDKYIVKGIYVYKVEDDDLLSTLPRDYLSRIVLEKEFFDKNKCLDKTLHYQYKTHTHRFHLPSGNYVFIAACASPFDEREFLVRFFTETN